MSQYAHQKTRTIGYLQTTPALSQSWSESLSWARNSTDVVIPQERLVTESIDYNDGLGHFNPCIASKGQMPLDAALMSQIIVPRCNCTMKSTGMVFDNFTDAYTVSYVGRWYQTLDLKTYSEDRYNTSVKDAVLRLQTMPFKPMMNIPQAIIELKDLPKLTSSVRDLTSWLKGLRKQNLRQLFHSSIITSAQLYLAKVFGIDPTVSDAKNFLGQVPDRISLGVRQVRYGKGQVVRAAFRCPVDQPLSLTAETKWDIPVEGYWGWPDEGHQSCIVDGSSQPFPYGYFPKYPLQNGVTDGFGLPFAAGKIVPETMCSGVVFGRVANDFSADYSILDDISHNADPWGTAWELTPLSFVVDWFANIGKALRQANDLQAARYAGYRLQDGIWLAKRVTTGYYGYHTHITCGVTDPTFSVWNNRVYTHYHTYGRCRCDRMRISKGLSFDRRQIRSDNGYTFVPIDTKGLRAQGSFQWTAGAALAIQNCEDILSKLL